jgi:hypothetical protein
VRDDRPAPAAVGSLGAKRIVIRARRRHRHLDCGRTRGVAGVDPAFARGSAELAAISGLGAAFFSACQAALRFNADASRLRISGLRIIIAAFTIAAGGFAMVGAQVGFAASVAGFAPIGVVTGPISPCSFALAARQPVGLAAASLFNTLTRLPATPATGAICANAVAAGRVCRLCGGACRYCGRNGCFSFIAPPRPIVTRGLNAGRWAAIALARPLLQRMTPSKANSGRRRQRRDKND